MPPAQLSVENEFLRALASGTLTFKPFQLTAAAAPSELRELDFTGVLSARRSNQEFRFALQCTNAWTRLGLQQFLRAVDKLRRASKLQPLLIVPYLSARHIDALDEAGVSGLDLSGNGLLQAAPSLYVRSSGASSKHKLRAPPTYVYRSWKLATLIPRLFVHEPFFPTVQSVLDACHARMMRHGTGTLPLTLPTVSKALSQLEDDLVIARRGRELRLLHPDRLLDGLVRNYKPPETTARFRGRTQLSPGQVWDILEKLRPDARAVVTGRTSAPRHTDMANTEQLQLYVSNASQIAEALQAQPTEAFPNLELFETNEEGVYFDAERDRTVNWSSLTQIYLELAAGGAREVEMANNLRMRLIQRHQP